MSLPASAHPSASVMNPPKRFSRPPLPGDGPSATPLPPLLTSCDFVPQGDGSYRAIPRKPQEKVTVKEAVRLTNYSRAAIYRLYNAGFVEGERQSPRKILLHVASLRAHLEAVRDPEFWTAARRLRYWGV